MKQETFLSKSQFPNMPNGREKKKKLYLEVSLTGNIACESELKIIKFIFF